ncbi:Uncharacterized protein SCF082_LOCUS1081 [Durusdinium trenchii]|uniref:Uncharacterized protein n=1 Tax=Durusdinium trenchii TaxID=1381693 RepID=A0ABP0HBT7_9DINO
MSPPKSDELHRCRAGWVLAKSVSAAQQVVGAKKLPLSEVLGRPWGVLGSELLLLLKTWTQLLSQLALREQLLAPGGWRGSSTNWVVFLVERISQDMYSFTVCNRGPAAAQYHPTKFIPDGLYGQKMKIQATLTFQVHRQHLCDPGFWAMAFGQWVPNATEYHRAEVLYDVLLPWLAGVSFGRLTEKLETPSDEGRWRTPCDSVKGGGLGTGGWFGCAKWSSDHELLCPGFL